MKTRKLQRMFPTVATIRKGSAKKIVMRNDRQVETVGDDLKNCYRVVFAPGADEIKADFLRIYGTDQPQKIRAMVCFASVWDAWECWNEAYSAGRMIARADDSHFLVLRDPLTGEYTVQGGEPYTEFHPGMKIPYERNGRTFELPIRCTGRLRLVLPELGRLVYFELKTTSYYDCQNISNQLAAIQGIADALNGGNAAGVPFYIYRQEREISWNKPDGSAQRVKKWLVQLEVDPMYVQTVIKRMSDFAMTGSATVGMLQPGAPVEPISGNADPDDEDDDEVDVPWEETAPGRPQPMAVCAPTAAPVDAGDTTPQPVTPETEMQASQTAREILDNAPHDERGRVMRPMAPEVCRAALQLRAEHKQAAANARQRGLLRMLIDQTFSDADKRHAVLKYLTGVESIKDVPDKFVLALLDWLAPEKIDTGEYIIDSNAATELSSIWPASSNASGT